MAFIAIPRSNVPLEIAQQDHFQKFLSVADENDLAGYDSYVERVKNKVKEEALKLKENGKELHPKFELLALALFKYDFHGAPSNWNCQSYSPDHKHEEVIMEWAHWVVERAYPKKESDDNNESKNVKEESDSECDDETEYAELIDKVIGQYVMGLIPDCFTFMMGYFT